MHSGRLLSANLLFSTYRLQIKIRRNVIVESWSNQACFGYTIMAAEDAGLNEEQIRKLIRKMHHVNDEVSVEEAAKYYRESDY